MSTALSRTKRVRFRLGSAGTLTSGDGKDQKLFDYTAGVVEQIYAGVDATGDTGGSTSVQINRVRAESDAELLSSTLDIAHDDSDGYGKAAVSTLQNTELQFGDLIRLDVDSIPSGTASSGLAVTVIVKITRDIE